jgi:hypothetical protein
MPHVYLLVRIVRGDPAKKQHPYHYPPCWNSEDVSRNMLGTNVYLGEFSRGGDEEEAMYFVEKQFAKSYAQQCPDYFDILNKPEADAWLAALPDMANVGAERVTNADVLMAIIAKNAAGIALNSEDLEALDPNSPRPGIGKSRRTADEIFETPNPKVPRVFTGKGKNS